MAIHENEAPAQPRILRGRVDSLSLYEITDYELEILEAGTVGTTYLNFAVFFLSVAASFLISLLSASLSYWAFTVFVVVAAVGFSSGTVLLVLWRRTRIRMAKVIQRIKARCEPQNPPAISGDPLEPSEGEAGST